MDVFDAVATALLLLEKHGCPPPLPSPLIRSRHFNVGSSFPHFSLLHKLTVNNFFLLVNGTAVAELTEFNPTVT